MVVHCSIYTGEVPCSDALKVSCSYVRVLRPPVALLSTSAACLYDALYLHPSSKPFEKTCASCNDVSHFRARNVARDDAIPNRNCNRKAFLKIPTTCCSDKVCSLHIEKRIEVFATTVTGVCMLSRLYSITLQMRTGGYYFRLLKAIKPVLSRPGCVIMRRGYPPAGAVEYAKQVVQMMLVGARRNLGQTRLLRAKVRGKKNQSHEKSRSRRGMY